MLFLVAFCLSCCVKTSLAPQAAALERTKHEVAMKELNAAHSVSYKYMCLQKKIYDHTTLMDQRQLEQLKAEYQESTQKAIRALAR